MKKICFVFLLLALLPPVVFAFSDVGEEDWFYPYVTEFAKQGIIHGYADGSFLPENEITNAEFVKLLVESMESTPEVADGHWAEGYVKTAEYLGFLKEDELDPKEYDEPIRRQRIARFTARALAVKEKTNVIEENAENPGFSDWATICPICKNEVAALYRYGIMRGMPDGRFYGAGHASRAEAVTVLARLIHPHLRPE